MIENIYSTPIYSAMVDNFDDIQKEMYSTISNLDFESPNKLSIELDCEEFEKEHIDFDDEVEEF